MPPIKYILWHLKLQKMLEPQRAALQLKTLSAHPNKTTNNLNVTASWKIGLNHVSKNEGYA